MRTDAYTLEQAIEEGWYLPNTNNGFCMCMCGELVPIAKNNCRKRGQIKGQPVRFIVRHNRIRGTKLSAEHVEAIIRANLGKKKSPAAKSKMREAKLGNKNPWFGKPLPLEIRKKMSAAQKGEKNHGWKGGITPELRAARKTIEYKEWRTNVFQRDDYTCQNPECGQRGGKLEAHHIKSFSVYKELRYEISNGVTYCEDCHLEWHKINGYKC